MRCRVAVLLLTVLLAPAGLRVNIFRGLVARAAVQIPVWEHLNGIQDVKPAFTAGLTYVF